MGIAGIERKKLWILLCVLLILYGAAGFGIRSVWGNNLRKSTSITVELKSMPVYTGMGVIPEEFADVRVFADLDEMGETEVSDLPISYSFYRYRPDRPYGPDESYDKIDWDEIPSKVGTYWMKAKFLGDNMYQPSSSEYCLFEIAPAKPVLLLYTDMTKSTRIGDTILVTAEFLGTGSEDLQPVGTAIFQAGSRFIDQAVRFYGNKAQVSYTLTAEPVDIKVQYHPGEESENYAKAEAVLENVMGIKREQEKLVIAGEPVAYGVGPYILSVAGGSGSGKLTYTSGDEKIAAIDQKGKITICHPGTVEIRVTKDGDDTYDQAEAVCQLTVSKGINPDKPKLPVLMQVTDREIRIKPTDGQEFSIDGGTTWKTSGRFQKLKAKKMYTVITRLTETELYTPGRSTKFLQVTTLAKQTPSAAKIPGSGDGQQDLGDGTDGTAGSGTDGGSGAIEQGDTGRRDTALAPAQQSRQWSSLGDSTSRTGSAASEDENTVSKNGRAAGQTGKKPEKAKGKVKGTQSEQAGDQDQQQEPDEPDREEEGAREEDGAEEENKIVATKAVRPQKRGVSLLVKAAVAGGILLAAAAAGTGWFLWRRKRRKEHEEYRDRIWPYSGRKWGGEDML